MRLTVAATPIPAAAVAAAVDPVMRGTNPYAFFAPGVRPPAPIYPQHQHQQFNGQVDTGFGYVPTQNYGGSQFPGTSPYGGGNWQHQQGNAGRQPIRFAALPILVQTIEVETAISWIMSCWPVLPADQAQGIFLFCPDRRNLDGPGTPQWGGVDEAQPEEGRPEMGPPQFDNGGIVGLKGRRRIG
jgi:hypothetical protein